jgi:hypothetical protein
LARLLSFSAAFVSLGAESFDSGCGVFAVDAGAVLAVEAGGGLAVDVVDGAAGVAGD